MLISMVMDACQVTLWSNPSTKYPSKRGISLWDNRRAKWLVNNLNAERLSKATYPLQLKTRIQLMRNGTISYLTARSKKIGPSKKENCLEKYITANPKESDKYPGYYFTPVSKEILITPLGEMKSTRTGEDMVATEITEKTPYRAIFLLDVGSRSLHRILAITFLKCPGEWESLQVNHKDGNKNNNSLNNLEWSTPTEDLVHAFATGLRSDNNVTVARNVETGEILEFYSQAECARVFNTLPAEIHRHLKTHSKHRLFQDKWELKRKSDPWMNLTKANVSTMVPLRQLRVLEVTDIAGLKEFTLYETIEDHAILNNISLEESNLWLEQGYSNKNNSLRVIRYIDYYREYKATDKPGTLKKIPQLSETKKKTFENGRGFKNPPTPISVVNLETNESKIYPSVQDFSEEVGAPRKTIQKGVWRSNGIWKHYKITYLR